MSFGKLHADLQVTFYSGLVVGLLLSFWSDISSLLLEESAHFYRLHMMKSKHGHLYNIIVICN